MLRSLAKRLLAPTPPALRTLWRVAFWLYAIAVFTATHWPALRIESTVVERPDLYIHLISFGGWFGLLWLTGYLGEPSSLKSIARCVIVACVYAAVDELLQGIPILQRTVAWDDYIANCSGIGLGAVIAVCVAMLARRSESSGGVSRA